MGHETEKQVDNMSHGPPQGPFNTELIVNRQLTECVVPLNHGDLHPRTPQCAPAVSPPEGIKKLTQNKEDNDNRDMMEVWKETESQEDEWSGEHHDELQSLVGMEYRSRGVLWGSLLLHWKKAEPLDYLPAAEFVHSLHISSWSVNLHVCTLHNVLLCRYLPHF